MRILATVCARGGSKGVKNKNLRPLLGKPLIVHTLEQAKATGLFTDIAVSSDSDEILEAAKMGGASLLVKRPDEMAHDAAPKLPAIKHCVLTAENVKKFPYEIIVDLDPTSPLRNIEDISGALELLLAKQGTCNVITAAKARRSPYFNLVERDQTGYVKLAKRAEKAITRRQDAPACFDMNASIYVWTREGLLGSEYIIQENTCLFEMPEERSLDIDSELDFELVAYLMERKRSIHKDAGLT